MYAVATDAGFVTALDTRGTPQWSVEVPPSAVSAPAVADGTLDVGCHENAVCAIE